MLPFPQRLRLQKDFQQVYAQQRALHTPLFSLYLAPNKLAHSRFAVLVSNKVSSRAVVRNQLKRRLRYWLEQHYPQFKPGWDVVISGKNKALSVSYAQLDQTLTQAWKKAKLWL